MPLDRVTEKGMVGDHLLYRSPAVADDLVRCSGVGKKMRGHLADVLAWKPDHIFAFEMDEDERLPPETVYVAGPQGERLSDPTTLDPWSKDHLDVILSAASDAADLLCRSPPDKVAFLCKAGQNRSRVLCALACLMAELKFQSQESRDAATPVCVSLRGLVQQVADAIGAAKDKNPDCCPYQAALEATKSVASFPVRESRHLSKRPAPGLGDDRNLAESASGKRARG
tara:strand:+ start:3034 stop:3714 length:681 start_codon:yes stop_codon:yes gene_type:complete